MDAVILILLVGAFALLITSHLALAVGLSMLKPRWHGPVALLLAPLAPYWGYYAGMRVRSGLWVMSLSVYVVARIAAEF